MLYRQPDRTVCVERVVSDAGQVLEFVLMKGKTLSARELVVGQASDDPGVLKDHLGETAENVLQRSDRWLQSMDRVHGASLIIAATKRSSRLTLKSHSRRSSRPTVNSGKGSYEHRSKMHVLIIR
ncbi:hypothetical protein [Bradyrhizobium sp. ORS 375]|uniref:hypothetical protein n=1 Tax=Bradyrhizobium sp. (strain ORS 375) TaxID=566679 RepID=UPI001FCC7C27|nr:hypothetical protein [Bradyrhizobium sp. ORS 375]